jgi:DnaJ domain
MPSLLSRLTGIRRPLSLAESHRLAGRALELLRQGKAPAEVKAALESRGASAVEAGKLTLQAVGTYENELVRSVSLPISATSDLNYYFLLGVTPKASTERIHRAYRRKARDVHPDRHDSEFTREYWSRLMALITDAHEVLSDPTQRRVYDVIWRDRSKQVAAAYRRKGEMRGDKVTRYLWSVAELSEIEDEISRLLDEVKGNIKQGQPVSELGSRLLATVESYEGRILEIRTNTHGLAAPFLHFGDTVRSVTQRKERLVPGLQQLGGWLADATNAPAGETLQNQIAVAEEMIEEVRAAQHQFDIAALR